VWFGLAEYINSIREIALSFVCFCYLFLYLLSLHFFSILSFLCAGVWLALFHSACRFPLCGAGFCLLVGRKCMDG